jgi:hypothetical protein
MRANAGGILVFAQHLTAPDRAAAPPNQPITLIGDFDRRLSNSR